MDILVKIKRDHDEARDLMEKIIATKTPEPRHAIFSQLKTAILSHAKSEEQTFYKALRKADPELGEEVPHMKKEHKDVEELFEEIEKLQLESRLWWEKFGELRNALLHHMEEEEEEIFPDAKKEIPAKERNSLGNKMDTLEESEKKKLKIVEAA